MKLNFTDLPKPVITLGEIANGCAQNDPNFAQLPSTFIYDGYVYVLLSKDHAKGLSINVPDNHRAVMNLKSQTIRAFRLTELVTPVEVEVNVGAKRTHRYQS